MRPFKHIALGLAFVGIVAVAGCKTDRQLPSGDSYPEYNCWWR